MAAVGAFFVFAVSPKDAPPSGTAIGGPFALTTQDGRAVSDRDFRGKWLMIYFGYTHCPNICPMTLGEIASTLDRLGPLAERVQPVFITIDPARDTGEVMDAYVKAFDSRIIGLTGTAAEIAAAAKGYRVYYAKKAVAGAGANDYEMEHSAYVYVMDPNGRYVTLFSPAGGQGAEQMEARLRELITPPKQ
jgi:protein SCO1/2